MNAGLFYPIPGFMDSLFTRVWLRLGCSLIVSPDSRLKIFRHTSSFTPT